MKGEKLVCQRCGHGADASNPWIQRGENPPQTCARCKNPYWAIPRRAKTIKEADDDQKKS